MTDRVELADELVWVSAKLLRWLRAEDPAPVLTGPQATALGVIIQSGRIRMSDLARLEEVSRPTITNTAAQLQSKKLIFREADGDDGRVFWLQATDMGLKVFFDGQARRIAPLAEAIAKLSDADRSALRGACGLLSALMPQAPK